MRTPGDSDETLPEDWRETHSETDDNPENASDSVVSASDLKPIQYLSRRYAPNTAPGIERNAMLLGKALWTIGLLGAGSYFVYSVVDSDPILSFFLALMMIGIAVGLGVSRP